MQCLRYRSKIWDFFNGKSPKFQVPILDLYCKHCTCRQQQRHKWRRLVLVAVAAYTTQVLTSCLLLVPADQSCAIVEPLVSSSGVAVQLLSPTWDEAAVAAAAVPATSSLPLVLPFLSFLSTLAVPQLVGVKNTNFQNSMGALSNPISFAIRISKQFLFSF